MDNKTTKPACPKCHGTNIQPVGRKRKGFSVGKAVAGGVLTGGIGTLAGFAGKNGKMEYYCSDCGAIFKKPIKMSNSDKKGQKEKTEEGKTNVIEEHDNKTGETKKDNKKTILIVVAVIMGLGIIGMIGGGSKKDKPQPQSSGDDTSQVETKKDNDEYLSELRKCTVMEGSDIYLTDNILYLKNGVGEIETDIQTAFTRAKQTCEGWYNDWGEEEFYELNEMDWGNRENEELDGHPLTYYLDKLGW